MSVRTQRSERAFAAARRLIPGGVNSPVRAFRSVGGTPRFIARGSGARIVDVDGNEFIDYVMSWGALALGHAHPAVREALSAQLDRGTTFGAPTELETELAAMVSSALPSMEMVRFVSTGTEAVMSAVRLARAATERTRIIKFAGCYHGHADSVLAMAESTHSVGSPVASDVLIVPYNSATAVARAFAEHPTDIAAVIVEPVAANMGLVLPQPGFLAALRDLTNKHGALLIFDEVVTGFRVGWGGAQTHFGVTPDLTCLGKIIGGGLPAAAFGGRADLMQHIAPAGRVYQAGTLSGNPLAMAAGLATLRELSRVGAYEHLRDTAFQLAQALKQAAADAGVAVQTQALGGLWGLFFSVRPVCDFDSAQQIDGEAYARFFHAMLAAGVYLPPSPFEACFVSTAHTAADIETTIAAITDSVSATADPVSAHDLEEARVVG